MWPRPPVRLLVVVLAAVAAGAACRAVAGPAHGPDDLSFGPPQPLVIRGYDGDAMEPFLSADGAELFFNTSNDPAADTELRRATRLSDLLYEDRGPIAGANSPALDGVPSLDDQGRFVFISTRAYDRTLATVFEGRYLCGRVATVTAVPGLEAPRRGLLIFDAALSPDGGTLVVADGRFDGGPVPRSADLALATRTAVGFSRLSVSATVLAAVNTADALEYAGALSADGRELFFTRATLAARPPRVEVLVARRERVDAAFALPQRIAAITGFAEAPALSGDGTALLFHGKDADGRHWIHRTTRAAAISPARSTPPADRAACR